MTSGNRFVKQSICHVCSTAENTGTERCSERILEQLETIGTTGVVSYLFQCSKILNITSGNGHYAVFDHVYVQYLD